MFTFSQIASRLVKKKKKTLLQVKVLHSKFFLYFYQHNTESITLKLPVMQKGTFRKVSLYDRVVIIDALTCIQHFSIGPMVLKLINLL